MGNIETPFRFGLEENIDSDPRSQLIDRILLTEAFQKSSRLPALLCYLAEHSLHGSREDLTEQRIGTAVFGKPADYSPVEDSAVRVHVRQLRLRLHEYFACDGRDETLIVEIPKGSYDLAFRSLYLKPSLSAPPIPNRKPEGRRIEIHSYIFWPVLVIAIICSLGWYQAATASRNAHVPWPVDAVIQNNRQTRIVVSDGRTMLRLLTQKKFTLEEYLQPDFIASMIPARMDENIPRLVKYISNSQMTSVADAMVASTLMKLASSHANDVVVGSARNLNQQDLDRGNYVFVGGATSNPWVSLFVNKLNFETVEDSVGGNMYFLNKKPLPGEQNAYEGLPHPGSGGDDYATISLLPSRGGGNVLILQGLREEGTEALGVLPADPAHRTELKRALKIGDDPKRPVYFEALIRAHTVAGAPVSISVVATRIVSP